MTRRTTITLPISANSRPDPYTKKHQSSTTNATTIHVVGTCGMYNFYEELVRVATIFILYSYLFTATLTTLLPLLLCRFDSN
jgi:multisubunit Na+/H+ antiporter MnhG subunit